MDVEVPGIAQRVQGEVHADQIRDGYVGDARMEKELGNSTQFMEDYAVRGPCMGWGFRV